MSNPDELQTYLELKRAMRESADALLKEAGMSWSKFIDLELMASRVLPPEGIVVGKYRVVVEETQTRIVPQGAEFGPPRRQVKIHEEKQTKEKQDA